MQGFYLQSGEQWLPITNEFLQRQKEHLVSIYEAYDGDEEPIQRDFKTFTYEDCLAFNPTIIAEESPEDIRDKSRLSKASSGQIGAFN